MSLNALIVGAGKIGALFDSPHDKNVLSHAHAYAAHPAFELAGFVDVDVDKAAKAAGLWGCGYFSSLQDAFDRQKIDVISVAVPDEQHFAILKALRGFSFSAVIVEKPIARSLDEGNELVSLYHERTPLVAVNYSRRYVPQFAELKRRIKSGEFGRYLTGSGYYGKGIVHNGSHLVDLIRFLVDEIADFDVGAGECDFYPDDPSVEGVLRFENGRTFHILPVSCRAYTVFELDLFFERRRIRIVDSGFRIEEQAVENSERFPGYLNLSSAQAAQTEMGKAMFFLMDNLHTSLLGRSEVGCTIEDALKDLEICSTMAASFRNI